MLQNFINYLISTCGCSAKNHFLVAVSGGVDSVVMAHLFHSAGFRFSICHCNFQLRGDESEKDEQFVSELAGKMEAIFHVKKFDTTGYSTQRGISIQMAARDLRYSWFEELSVNHGYEFISVGHNKNDIVETMLLNLSRGTGIRGLTGIKAVNKKIVRPVLFASRQEILEYAKKYDLKWRDDSSNKETKYHRNKIRHTIIPAFESINPAFLQNTLETINRLGQTGKLLEYLIKQVRENTWTELPDRIVIHIDKLKAYPAHDILLFELLRDFGVNQLSSEMILNSVESATGKQFHTHTHTITHNRDQLIITRNAAKDSIETMISRETLHLDYPVRLFFSYSDTPEGFKIPNFRNIAAFDADRIKFPLKLRRWKPGDRFHPLGLKGSKKVSDFLINIKIPLPDKQKVWILESDGEIAWLVNHRIDDRFKVTAETRNILLIEYNV